MTRTALAVVLCLLSASALAHEPYTSWQRPDGGGSCCNDMDCHELNAWRIHGDHYEAQIVKGGAWWPIPNAVVLHDQHSPNGFAHGCYTGMASDPHWLCFVPGTGV